MNKVRLALVMLILLGSIFASKNIMAVADTSKQPENRKLNYAKKLRDFAQNLSDKNRGYFSGRYENSQLGVNASVDVNTNAIVLESLLYKAIDIAVPNQMRYRNL
ncbi:MAG: DUF3131 domain-containing protein [Nostoc sp. ChiSLP01]|nr:DUF3131 domain-containing protein [Nostoc sp. CmiSLP01]MDZ8287150.1 DUF3131 domain-containing protein [Nostoc sp. ChiSLP01]